MKSRLLNFIKTKFTNAEDKEKKSAGKMGEVLACKFIKKHRYKVIEKNFRSKYGEIDIVAKDGETYCFIEVKARSRNDYGLPQEHVTNKKQMKIIKTAHHYITNSGIENENMRFDIVAVSLSDSQCNIIKNAFDNRDI